MPKTETLLIVGSAIVSIPLFLIVHEFYSWLCIRYIKRYCTKNKIEFTKWRIAPAFDSTGVKTESSLVEVLSENGEEKKTFRFVVWPFGIRKVYEFRNENHGA